MPVARVAGPPADGDLLRVHRVAHDEVVAGRLGRLAREEADREVERAPPRVDRRRAPAIGRAERGEHQRRPRRGGEVGRDLRGVVARVLLVLVEAAPSTAPPAACGSNSTSPASSRTAASTSRVTSPTERSGVSAMPRSRPSLCSTTRLVVRAGRARRRARRSRRAPAAAAVSQPRAVRRSAACCSCGSGGRQHRRELAEDLRVAVQRVARLAPLLVAERRPCQRHASSV